MHCLRVTSTRPGSPCLYPRFALAHASTALQLRLCVLHSPEHMSAGSAIVLPSTFSLLPSCPQGGPHLRPQGQPAGPIRSRRPHRRRCAALRCALRLAGCCCMRTPGKHVPRACSGRRPRRALCAGAVAHCMHLSACAAGAVLLDENLQELNLTSPTLVGPRAYARLQRALWSGADCEMQFAAG